MNVDAEKAQSKSNGQLKGAPQPVDFSYKVWTVISLVINLLVICFLVMSVLLPVREAAASFFQNVKFADDGGLFAIFSTLFTPVVYSIANIYGMNLIGKQEAGNLEAEKGSLLLNVPLWFFMAFEALIMSFYVLNWLLGVDPAFFALALFTGIHIMTAFHLVLHFPKQFSLIM